MVLSHSPLWSASLVPSKPSKRGAEYALFPEPTVDTDKRMTNPLRLNVEVPFAAANNGDKGILLYYREHCLRLKIKKAQ
jgi:hypothetical protein